MDLVSPLSDALLNLAFPQPCRVCSRKVVSRAHGIACVECWERTQFFDPAKFQCQKCGIRGEGQFVSPECPVCRDHPYDLARALAAYSDAMSASIVHLKRFPTIPKIILERLAATLRSGEFGTIDLIVPVPLSKKRYIERGFNQAEVIARSVAKVLGIPVDPNSLIRKKHTPMHRAAMDKKARETTVRNAFEVLRPNLIFGRSVLLVDDVFTSGATVSYCAKALKKKGAASVKVFTLARAL